MLLGNIATSMCVPLWSNHNQYFDPMNIVVHSPDLSLRALKVSLIPAPLTTKGELIVYTLINFWL